MRPNIGEFLSALRRSKGLTQQEVADRLGVSNKTVSSWETGASYPDISMLSSIAELYGVTCDEILRGERIPPAEPQERTEQRREKNLSRLLAGYRNNASAVAWICAGLYAVAVIAALLIGCVALESLIGFFVGLIFLLAGTLLCVIQYKYLRFQLTQNDFASDAVQAFLQALRRRQTGVLSFPVFNPDYQGGLEELSDESYRPADDDPVYSEEKEERCLLFVRFGSPLYEDAAAESAAVTFAAVFAGVVLFWIAAAGVYTVFYVRRRKKFRAAHAAAQQGGGGTMPDEECRM